jgi:dienelactone hydrolase
LKDFVAVCFTDSTGTKRQVYVKGDAGPPVILLHELPGLTEETLSTARQLAAARYTVVVPLLFGQPGERATIGNARRICGNDQFACNEGDVTAPAVTWLRELAVCARREWPEGKGVGAIGMCLTGTFPVAMLRVPEVVAPVLCQPTLPFNRHNPLHFFGWLTDQRALALHPDDLEHARGKTTVPLLGIRYKGDGRCKKERFERLTRAFPNRFYRVDFPGRHHSTLVGDFCPDALTEVLAFFNHHLRSAPDACAPRFPFLSAHSLTEVTPEGCRGSASPAPQPHGNSSHLPTSTTERPCSSL